jgi:hypothetical protein
MIWSEAGASVCARIDQHGGNAMDFNQYSQPIGPTAYNPYQFSPQGQSGQTGFPGNAAFGNAIPGSQFGATQFGSTLGSAPGFTPGFAPGNGFGFQSQQTDPTFAYTLQLQQQQLLQQLQQLQQLKQLQLAQLAQQLQQAQLFQQLPQQGLGGGPFGNSSPAFGSAASFAPQAQLLPQ